MSATILNSQTLTQAPQKRLSFSTPYSGPLAEPNTWFVSLLIATALHIGFLWIGKALFITPPDYGIESIAASMEVYMVAAVPETVPEIQTLPVEKITETVPEAPSEMTVPKVEKVVEPKKVNPPEEKPVKKVEIEKKQVTPEFKGDGSSAKPGESKTTLFSQASSETFGKSGKFHNPPPQYPSLAERNGWEGTVMLKALVEKEGLASQVLIESSSGFKVLDNAALKTVKKWKFEPGRAGSVVIASWIKIPVRFRIEKSLNTP